MLREHTADAVCCGGVVRMASLCGCWSSSLLSGISITPSYYVSCRIRSIAFVFFTCVCVGSGFAVEACYLLYKDLELQSYGATMHRGTTHRHRDSRDGEGRKTCAPVFRLPVKRIKTNKMIG